MENVTYEAYRSNPAIREQLELEARHERRMEVDRLLVTPLVRWAHRIFAAMTPTSARTSPSFTSLQS
jgi:hypothetical protein